jgi:elongation factor G
MHTAKLRLRVEPMPTAAGVVVGTVPNAGLPGDMLNVVLEELENAGQGGGVLGFPLMRIKATLLSGQMQHRDRLPHGRGDGIRCWVARRGHGPA